MEKKDTQTETAAASVRKGILRNKYYLYLTEFFAGMSVMAVELGASRLLAPYFSSSQIVWTIIIGTIMIAMALGNIRGGRSADKDPSPDRLYKRIMIAAVWIALIPVLGRYIIIGISAALVFTISNNFLICAAFLACMVIFVFPLFLLGTVTPSLVKYTVDSLDDSGKTVGALGAFNTIGSIIGTFMPTFVTIPYVGTAVTFLIFAGILLALALIYFISAGMENGTRNGRKYCITGVILFLISCIFIFSDGFRSDSFAFWEDDLLYEGESIYNYLQVKDTDDSVILSTNVLFGVQSIMKKDGGATGMYYDYAMAAPVMAGKTDGDILILGMGTGTFAKQCRYYYGNTRIEGVEIDAKITDLAGKYFELPSSVPVTTYDGRAYLEAVPDKSDVIMVDAYQDITIPFQMSSVEFFTLVKEHLNENGVMVVNMNMHTDAEGNINEYLSDTIASVFEYVYTVDVPYTTNRELFATRNPDAVPMFKAESANVDDEDLYTMLNNTADRIVPYEKGDHILTDDKAPVELLGMRVIDDLIKNELEYYRGVFKNEGIKGLLN